MTTILAFAFLIKNYVEDYFKWKVEITCSGKDYNLLNRAKNGIFSKDYFSRFYVRNFEEFLVIDEEKEVKDLDSLGNEIKIIQEIKDMIIFDMRDVLSSLSPPIKGCDMIIARNFLTDLSLEDTQKVLEIFSASLKSGGLLFLSEVESIESYSKDFVLSEIINRPYFVRV
jgi:chemotaxis methyl-accepting protein methylase